MLDAKTLTSSLTAVVSVAESKTANAFNTPDEQPTDNVSLQEIVGDPDTHPLSWNSQFKPSQGDTLVHDPNSPVQGDDIFWNGLMSGARFQDKNGDWWDVENYGYDEGSVVIRKTWYPDDEVTVSVQDVRRSIHSWTEPILVRVPPPPAGIDYGVLETRVIQ